MLILVSVVLFWSGAATGLTPPPPPPPPRPPPPAPPASPCFAGGGRGVYALWQQGVSCLAPPPACAVANTVLGGLPGQSIDTCKSYCDAAASCAGFVWDANTASCFAVTAACQQPANLVSANMTSGASLANSSLYVSLSLMSSAAVDAAFLISRLQAAAPTPPPQAAPAVSAAAASQGPYECASASFPVCFSAFVWTSGSVANARFHLAWLLWSLLIATLGRMCYSLSLSVLEHAWSNGKTGMGGKAADIRMPLEFVKMLYSPLITGSDFTAGPLATWLGRMLAHARFLLLFPVASFLFLVRDVFVVVVRMLILFCTGAPLLACVPFERLRRTQRIALDSSLDPENPEASPRLAPTATPLMRAVASGNRPEARRLLATLPRGADVRVADLLTGETALHMAVIKGQYKMVSLLLGCASGIEALNQPTRTAAGALAPTPLACAITHAHADIVRLLLASGADFAVRDAQKRRAVDLARSLEMVPLPGTGEGDEWAHVRSRKERLEIVKILEALPAPPPRAAALTRSSSAPARHMLPLAAQTMPPPSPSSSSLRLASAPASFSPVARQPSDRAIGFRDSTYSETPPPSPRPPPLPPPQPKSPTRAALLGEEQWSTSTPPLTESPPAAAAPQPPSPAQPSLTPLMRAVESNDLKEAERLLEAGADARAADTEFGETALHIAIATGQTELVNLILDFPSGDEALNSPTYTASGVHAPTPLMYAVLNGEAEIAEMLAESGADVEARDAWGRTALDLARESMAELSMAGDAGKAAEAVEMVKTLERVSSGPIPRSERVG